MRTHRRRYEKENDTPEAMRAQGRIKIGFDKKGTQWDKRAPGKQKYSSPAKLRGMLICRNSISPGTDTNLVVDEQAMNKLGFSMEQVDKAKAGGLNAPDGLLPRVLHFMLVHSAERSEGGEYWLYPNTFGEDFESYNNLGRFCHGDGLKASRKQEDGTSKEIPCVPVGAAGAEAKDFCQISVSGKCKAKSRLILCLFYVDEEGGKQYLDDRLESTGRWSFDTTSEYMAKGFLDALDEAADRLKGNISGVTGTLNFGVGQRRTGNAQSPVGNAGILTMQLDEVEIQRREGLMRQALAAPEQVKQLAEPQKQIEESPAEAVIIKQGDPLDPASWEQMEGRACRDGETPKDRIKRLQQEKEENEPPIEQVEQEVVEEEEPVDDPGPPEEEPGPQQLEELPILQIVGSIEKHIELVATEEGKTFEEIQATILWSERRGSHFDYESLGYLIGKQASPEQREKRHNAACQIAQRLLDEDGTKFFIRSMEELAL